jgi:hypothetical protein
MNDGVRIPIFVRKKVTIGSSKINPVARHIDVRVPIYDRTLIWLTTDGSILYELRKCIESGASIKYPNRTPIKNKNEAANTAPLA